MENITPKIGCWYEAGNGTSRYVMKLTGIQNSSFTGKPWRVFPNGEWVEDSVGGFNELIKEIPCPEEFNTIIEQYEIY